MTGALRSIRCWLIRRLAGRDSFVINANVTGRVELQPGSGGLYVGGGYVHGETRRASERQEKAL